MTPGKLWRAHRQGMTLDQLAERTGLSRYQVHRMITSERWRYGEVVISERVLRAMIKEGLTIRQMAERHMCSTGCICKKLKKFGLKTRRPGNPLWVAGEREQ